MSDSLLSRGWVGTGDALFSRGWVSVDGDAPPAVVVQLSRATTVRQVDYRARYRRAP